MADGMTIARVRKIVEEDKTRRFLVLSAPGKRFGGEEKITDLLYETYDSVVLTGKCGAPFAKAKGRFFHLADELGIGDPDSLLKETEEEILQRRSKAFTASRGEYLVARFAAEYLRLPFIDAAEIIRFHMDGSLDLKETCALASRALFDAGRAVVPGFYGRNEAGEIVTFSRGGSDISGAVVARAVGADLYENWTDVSGFLVCDPRIVENPAQIKQMTFQELGTLSYFGASVLHLDSVSPVREVGIPVSIRNTFRPEEEGTLIVPERSQNARAIPTGIAGRKNFTFLRVPKESVAAQKRFKALVNCGVQMERTISGRDSLLFIFSRDEESLDRIRTALREPLFHGGAQVCFNAALIAVVGCGLKENVGMAARILKGIAQTGVNLRLIDFGSEESALYLGVDEEDYERVIRAVYEEFFKEF